MIESGVTRKAEHVEAAAVHFAELLHAERTPLQDGAARQATADAVSPAPTQRSIESSRISVTAGILPEYAQCI